ncbi:hypothetical protein K439DRAFT_1399704 [Ramaria rubella]|nr:hypothetical protein K439DRAFT_1399704 [Ramaria rubella]
MNGRYTPLPNPLARDAEHELHAAFESDDDSDDDEQCGENTPLHPLNTLIPCTDDPLTSIRASDAIESSYTQQHATIPGSYDFEADPFDYAAPPPGSPPGPTTFALPNRYGNSNGQLPSNPVIPRRSGPRTGFFRRAVGALLPSHYQSLPTEEGSSMGPARGGGTNNDGVFANMTAKPGRGVVIHEGESIHVVPEEVQKEVPPSYAVAQADAAPAYYETFVHAPSSGLDGEVLVDALPTGSIFTFAWTMLISLSFQFVGFLLTYLLHTTHAGRFGSRAGLGITIIQYAFFLRRRALMASGGQYDANQDPQLWWDESADVNPNLSSNFNGTIPNATPTVPSGMYQGYFSSGTTEWLAFFLMSVGWFVLLTSLLGFWRVKRWERGIRQASEPVPTPTPEDFERDRHIRSSLFAVFGIASGEEPQTARSQSELEARASDETESRLTRSLQSSGLL